eukprot:4325486-Amphidinium_carterae.2
MHHVHMVPGGINPLLWDSLAGIDSLDIPGLACDIQNATKRGTQILVTLKERARTAQEAECKISCRSYLKYYMYLCLGGPSPDSYEKKRNKHFLLGVILCALVVYWVVLCFPKYDAI